MSSSGNVYLMFHYNLSSALNDPKNLDKINYDVPKWYLFVTNLTEEGWHESKKVIDDDYAIKLKFQ